jgi:hypothetical protein
MQPGGAVRDEYALERDERELGRLADRFRCSFELAEDDLVLAHQDRAEVANVPLPTPETGFDLAHAPVESRQVGLVDVGPEAFGYEPLGALHHPASVAHSGRSGKP